MVQPYDPKPWFDREMDRLEDLGRADGDTQAQMLRKLLPDDAENVLPESFYDIIHAFFRNYHHRVMTYLASNPTVAYSFMVAHGDIYRKFQFGDYHDMAGEIGMHFIQIKERERGLRKPPPNPRIIIAPSPPSPVSGPTTLCEVDTWLDELEDAKTSPPQHNKLPSRSCSCGQTETCSHNSATLLDPSQQPLADCDRKETSHTSSPPAPLPPQQQPPQQQPQRTRYPRSAKAKQPQPADPVAAKGRMSRRNNISRPTEAGATTPSTRQMKPNLMKNKRQRLDEDVPMKKQRRVGT